MYAPNRTSKLVLMSIQLTLGPTVPMILSSCSQYTRLTSHSRSFLMPQTAPKRLLWEIYLSNRIRHTDMVEMAIIQLTIPTSGLALSTVTARLRCAHVHVLTQVPFTMMPLIAVTVVDQARNRENQTTVLGPVPDMRPHRRTQTVLMVTFTGLFAGFLTLFSELASVRREAHKGHNGISWSNQALQKSLQVFRCKHDV